MIECHDLSHDDAIRYIDEVEEFSQENGEMVDWKYVKIHGEETTDEDIYTETETPAPPPMKKLKVLKPSSASQKTTAYKAIIPKPSSETTYIKFSNFGGEDNEFVSPLTVDQNCIQIVSPISPEIVEQNENQTTESVKTSFQSGDDAQQRLTEQLSNICSHFSDEEFAYSMHIANQLRNLPRFDREVLRNKIDNLIYKTNISVMASQSN